MPNILYNNINRLEGACAMGGYTRTVYKPHQRLGKWNSKVGCGWKQQDCMLWLCQHRVGTRFI